MTVQKTTFHPGTLVKLIDRTRGQHATVLWTCPCSCPEDGKDVYRIRFSDGREAEICRSVLVVVREIA